MFSAQGKLIHRLRGAFAWRIRALVGDELVDNTFVKVAKLWRPLLNKTVFIAIGGSVGKTTSKELLVSVLSEKAKGTGNPESLNVLPEVAKTVLRVRPRHGFCIAELSEDRPGILDAPLTLFKPSIGIVTVIGNDHWSAYDGREGIAAEVGKVAYSLPSSGTAVLNADDPLVLAMATDCPGKVITYGSSSHADLRAEDINSRWPDRLRMTLVYGDDRVALNTQLCGTHWTPSVLSAVGAGLAIGMTLSECAAGILASPPFEGRMQPVTTSSGVTFIRDDWKAPLWTVDTCLEFMKDAKAVRKIVIVGSLSDGTGSSIENDVLSVALRAQQIADHTIFVGRWATSALKAPKLNGKPSIRAFSHVRDASAYLKTLLRDGDLVLLKGTNKQDHLMRIVMACEQEVACWRDDCERITLCRECPDLSKRSGLPVLLESAVEFGSAEDAQNYEFESVNPDDLVIVGLGNPEPKYLNTPHNVGYEVVDRLAETLGLTWEETPWAWIARSSSGERCVHLLKVKAAMNLTGAGLKKVADGMSFGPEQCVLVFDDLALPLGTVRTRPKGSAGGHRGVASVLEAFQTDQLRRVKVGIKQPENQLDNIEYVLSVFDVSCREQVDQAVLLAKTHCLELVSKTAKST
jgi:UDP-N-acetylmuramoyl-tripeptide--D-alanyl-D-alanine ligase